MDFGEIFRMVGQFFINYCNITVSFFGVRFTVGALLLWCALAVLIINFLRSMSS